MKIAAFQETAKYIQKLMHKNYWLGTLIHAFWYYNNKVNKYETTVEWKLFIFFYQTNHKMPKLV